MKVLTRQEWRVLGKPYHGMVKLKNLTENMYLLCDIVKIYDKVAKTSYVYTVQDKRIVSYDVRTYNRLKATN